MDELIIQTFPNKAPVKVVIDFPKDQSLLVVFNPSSAQ